MSTSPHICCADCDILSDDFNRANGGPGCLWEPRHGNWSVNNQLLHENGTPGALIVARRQPPDLGFLIGAETPQVASGAAYRLIANYVDDDNYQFAEYAFTATELTMRLHRRTNGSDGDPLVSRTWNASMVGNEQSFGLYLSPKLFWATQKYPPYQVWVTNPSLFTAGYGSGLGNGAAIALDYDNFLLRQNGDVLSGCTKVACRCDDFPLPMDLTARCTLAGGLAACEAIDVPLRAHITGSPNFSGGEWYGSAETDCSDCNIYQDPITLYVTFRCDCQGDGRRYSIWVKGVCGLFETEGSACELSASHGPNGATILFEIYNWLDGGYCIGQSGWMSGVQVSVTG